MDTQQQSASAEESASPAASSVYSGLITDPLVNSRKTLSISWNVYKGQWKSYAGLVLLILASMLVPLMAFIFIVFGGLFLKTAAPNFSAIMGGLSAVTVIIGVLLFIPFIVWILLLAYTGVLLPGFADERARIGTVFKFTWSKFRSLLWVAILYGFIIAVGILLFIIPGIIWSIYYCMAFYACAFEDKRGMDALRRSKELVKGYVWTIMRRSGFWMYFALLSGIVGTIPLFGWIWSIIALFIITPFQYVYYFSVYLTIRERKNKGFATDVATGRQKMNTILLLFGPVFLFTILVIIGIASKTSDNSNAFEEFEDKNITGEEAL